MMNVPCYNCPDRCVGCHSTCEKYKAFRAVCDKANEARRKENSANEAWAARGDKIRKDAHKFGLKGRLK